ncbi:MAG: hypothetical protein WB611_25990, partial [Stellaceae bacterium]
VTTPLDSTAPGILTTAWTSFLASLEPISGAARLIGASTQLDGAGIGSIRLPWVTDVAGVGFVAEDQPIPIFRSTTSDVTMPLGCEIAAAFVVSNRLLAQSNAEAVFTTLLRRTIALTLDAEMFGTTAAVSSPTTSGRPGGLLNGLNAIPAAATMSEDFANLADSLVTSGGDASVMYFASPGRVIAVQTRSPQPLPIYPSSRLSSARLVAICPTALFTALGVPTIDITKEATVNLSNTPLELVDTGGAVAHPVSSLWQTAATGIMVTLAASWALANPNLAAFTDVSAW